MKGIGKDIVFGLLLFFVILFLIMLIPIKSQHFLKMICKNNEQIENDIYFIIKDDSTLDLEKLVNNSYLPYMQIRLYIATNENIDEVIMHSYSLNLNGINIEFNNNNHNAQYLKDETFFYNDFSYRKSFVLQINLKELENKISESHIINNLKDLKKVLKKVKTAEYKCQISYKYNNETIETEFIYRYNVKLKSTRFWEIAMFLILFFIFGPES
jgi:hypothetical protein